MKKKLKQLVKIFLLLGLLFGFGKLYIGYNLARYAGYYVQYMPRKAETHPELAIILDYLFNIERPDLEGVKYDSDGTNAIYKDRYITLTIANHPKEYIIYDFKKNMVYVYNKQSAYSYAYSRLERDERLTDKQHEKEAEAYLNDILPRILAVQSKPWINLQDLFNQKHSKRFNE